MNLSEVIKENLKNKGLKQSFLSKQHNISDQLLSHKLSNNTLRTDELFKIAKILGINLNKFKEA